MSRFFTSWVMLRGPGGGSVVEVAGSGTFKSTHGLGTVPRRSPSGRGLGDRTALRACLARPGRPSDITPCYASVTVHGLLWRT
ncbi:hypothetical protein ACWIG5_25530 [Streptomyces lydicus]